MIFLQWCIGTHSMKQIEFLFTTSFALLFVVPGSFTFLSDFLHNFRAKKLYIFYWIAEVLWTYVHICIHQKCNIGDMDEWSIGLSVFLLLLFSFRHSLYRSFAQKKVFWWVVVSSHFLSESAIWKQKICLSSSKVFFTHPPRKYKKIKLVLK